MENIIRILEALENGKLSNVDLVELNACYPGCVGGALTVENPFIAKARILRLMRHIGPVLPSGGCPTDDMRWEKKPEASHALRLDPDLSRAMEMMEEIRELTGYPAGDGLRRLRVPHLPGLRRGCGLRADGIEKLRISLPGPGRGCALR